MTITSAGALSANGNIDTDGDVTLAGALAANGNVTLGNASSDTVQAVGHLTASAGLLVQGADGDYAVSVAEGVGGVRADEFVTYSDRNLKTNIQLLDGALDKVMMLEPTTYEKVSTGKSEIGFIAQEVAKVVPEICALDANGEGRGIDYSRMSTLLVGALKAQQDQIAQLKEIVAKLQK